MTQTNDARSAMKNSFTTYAGKRITKKNPIPGGDGQTGSQMPDAAEIARGEAEEIVASAHRQAEEYRTRKFAEIEVEFEQRLAEKLAEVFRDTHLGLEDAAIAITRIVETAVRSIIGDARDPENIIAAARHALRDYQDKHSLELIVSSRDYSRVGVLLKTGEYSGEFAGVKLVQDSTMTPGQCALATADQRFNIGVEAQISVLKHAITKSAAAVDDYGADLRMERNDEAISDSQ